MGKDRWCIYSAEIVRFASKFLEVAIMCSLWINSLMKIRYFLLLLLVNTGAMADGGAAVSSQSTAKDIEMCGAKIPIRNLPLNPETILQDIDSCGATTTIRKLTCGSELLWNLVLKKIESGASRWLDVAGELAAGTDAATSEDILVTLARVLPKNPGGVLRLADSQSFLSIDELCGAPFIEPDPDYFRQYLIEAQNAVEALNDAEVEEPRVRCLARLERIIAEEHARHSSGGKEWDLSQRHRSEFS